MMRWLTAAMLLALALPCQAGEIWRFSLGSAAPGITGASGSLELSDEAFRDGVSIHADQFDPTPDWGALGLVGLSFMVNGRHVGLSDLVTAPTPFSMLRWSLDLRSAAGGGPAGTLAFNTGAWDVAWRLDGGNSGGRFGTDNPSLGRACIVTGACVFTGSFAAAVIPGAGPQGAPGATPVAVPEPLAVAVFGLGLAGLAVMGRRWNAAARVAQRGRGGL